TSRTAWTRPRGADRRAGSGLDGTGQASPGQIAPTGRRQPETTGMPLRISTTQVLPGSRGSGFPAVVRNTVPDEVRGRDQVPLIRTPCRNTDTAPLPTV